MQPLGAGRLDQRPGIGFAEQGGIDARAFLFFEAHAAGGVGLRVEVDQQHVLFACGEAGSEVDGGSRFSDAAFLICECDNFSAHGQNFRFGIRGSRCLIMPKKE